MEVDWIIAFVVFLGFVIWSFGYYSGIFPSRLATQDMSLAASLIGDRVVNYLEMDVYDVPIKYDSEGNVSGAVLYFNYTWPSEDAKNSAKVLIGNTSLPCLFSDDTLYFQSNLSSGSNYFTARFNNQSSTLNCGSSFSTSGANLTLLWAEEKSGMLSLEKINTMLGMNFSAFRNTIGSDRNFRVLIDYLNGTEYVYGVTPPNATNVYVSSTWNLIEESSGRVKISVLVW